MDLYEELTGLLDLLAEKEINYALYGGIAVAFHGYPRFTKDIDIMIQPADIDRAIQAVAERGFVFSAGLLPFDTGGAMNDKSIAYQKSRGRKPLHSIWF